jgi:hypothetical protein
MFITIPAVHKMEERQEQLVGAGFIKRAYCALKTGHYDYSCCICAGELYL